MFDMDSIMHFLGPDGPMESGGPQVLLLGQMLLFGWRSGVTLAPAGFTYTAVIIASRYGFSVWDQYKIVIAMFFAVQEVTWRLGHIQDKAGSLDVLTYEIRDKFDRVVAILDAMEQRNSDRSMRPEP
jgi:hypothetical protein